MREVDWIVFSDDHLYRSIKYIREKYGADVRIVFTPQLYGSCENKTDETIYSKAIARFQHLVIFEE